MVWKLFCFRSSADEIKFRNSRSVHRLKNMYNFLFYPYIETQNELSGSILVTLYLEAKLLFTKKTTVRGRADCMVKEYIRDPLSRSKHIPLAVILLCLACNPRMFLVSNRPDCSLMTLNLRSISGLLFTLLFCEPNSGCKAVPEF